jgi:polar amino acid transport system substrate-binding protein
MRAFVSLLLAATLSLGGSFASARDNVLRMRVTSFAPQYFLQGGRWVGLDVELAEAIAGAAGLSVSFVELPWSRALQQLDTGDIDLVANLSPTPDREKAMDFVGPVRRSRQVLVVRQEYAGLKIETLDDLAEAARRLQRPVGIQQDVKYSEELNARFARDEAFAQAFEAVPRAALLPLKTVAGHNFGFIEDSYFARYNLRHDPALKALAIHGFTVNDAPSCFGFSKHLPDGWLVRLDAAYRRLEADGTLARIRARWD